VLGSRPCRSPDVTLMPLGLFCLQNGTRSSRGTNCSSPFDAGGQHRTSSSFETEASGIYMVLLLLLPSLLCTAGSQSKPRSALIMLIMSPPGIDRTLGSLPRFCLRYSVIGYSLIQLRDVCLQASGKAGVQSSGEIL
jgi:hypothetical protein